MTDYITVQHKIKLTHRFTRSGLQSPYHSNAFVIAFDIDKNSYILLFGTSDEDFIGDLDSKFLHYIKDKKKISLQDVSRFLIKNSVRVLEAIGEDDDYYLKVDGLAEEPLNDIINLHIENDYVRDNIRSVKDTIWTLEIKVPSKN